jgi:hypothetical protein
MKLLRCDACLGEGPIPERRLAGPAGWAHVHVTRAVDLRRAADQFTRHVLAATEQANDESLDKSPAEGMAAGLRAMLEHPYPSTVADTAMDLCPTCAAKLSITLDGVPLADLQRALGEPA